MSKNEKHVEMIKQVLESHGFTRVTWDIDPDDETDRATIGRFRAINGDDDCGIYESDEGVLTAFVTGAAEHHNETVRFGFTIDGQDCPMDVHDLDDMESID